MQNSFGPAITNNGGTVTLLQNIFQNNITPIVGAALMNVSGTVSSVQDQFINNVAANGGGAIVNGGTLTITAGYFTNNSTMAGNGGALLNVGTTTINNSQFLNNSASNGGGAISNEATASLTITNNSFFQNNNASGSGAAIYNPSTGAASSQDTDYVNNDCTVNPITDISGNTVTSSPGCPGAASVVLDVSLLTCMGDNLQFTINAGDANFDITATSGPGLPLYNAAAGLYGLIGPGTWVNVTVTELRGDRETVLLGSITCPPSSALNASATCVGDNLQVSILSGDPAFTVYADSGTLLTTVPLGTYTIAGPNTWTNLTVIELMGDMQVLNLGDITCGGGASVPLVLGCTLDAPNGVTLADAPDNTYCRVLMRNGAVTEFSGAIPANLINLGVKLAVDVYRLEGGRSITEFPSYARVCLAGQNVLYA